MVPVGVLLIVLAVAFGAGFLGSSGESADIQFYGLKLQDLPARNLVILGIVTGLILALGAESVRWGTARWRRRRRLARRRERELQAAVEQAGQRESDLSVDSDKTSDTADDAAAQPEGSVDSAESATPQAKSDDASEPPASDTTEEPATPASDPKSKDSA